MQRRPRRHDENHLAFIRQLPCCVCFDNIHTQAAHIRYSDGRIGKTNPGVGAKPSDIYVLALCNAHHEQQHSMGSERRFWELYKIDPILIALALYSISGDMEEAERIILAQHPGINILAAG